MFLPLRLIKGSVLFSLPIIILCLGSIAAQAVQVSPPRVVIGPDNKTSYVYIKNNTQKVQGFRFRWKNLAMAKDGSMVNLDKLDASLVPDFQPAESYIRFSPRRTTLKPGETQRVTFLVRRPPEMGDGEFRSHFLVERIPPTIDANSKAAKDEAPTVASFGVGMSISRAFPVYLLNGKVHATLSLDGAKLRVNADREHDHQATHIIGMDVSKVGNRSVIATAEVYCGVRPITRAPKLFAIYAEADRRHESIYIDPPEGCGDMRIVITAHPDDQLAGQILAEGRVER
jgi:hypothetical protein